MLVEFLIPRRPVSLQAKNRRNLQAWKNYVSAEAKKAWPDAPVANSAFHLKLVYLYDQDPVDVDNIIKPIQDALDGVIYTSDIYVTDVESHRRPIAGTYDVLRIPRMIMQAILSRQECVYVQVSIAKQLEDYL